MSPIMIAGAIFISIFGVGCSWAVWILISQAKNDFIRILRMLSAGLGFLCFFGARAADLSIPDLMLFSSGIGGGALHSIVTALIPAFVGSIVSFLLFKAVGKMGTGNERSVYLLICLTTLVAFLSFDSFLQALNSDVALPSLLPNLSFIVGVLTTMLFGLNLPEVLKNVVSSKSRDETDGINTDDNSWKNDL